MSFLQSQSSAWDAAFWEFSLVFEEMEDADLWRRPHPRLVSVGELVAHVVYALESYAAKLDSGYPADSPLRIHEARYYLHNVETPIVLELTVAQAAAELDRVQRAVKDVFLKSAHSRADALTFEGPGRTFGEFADYMIFHAAYHTGQAFSARHLMGHATNDN